MSQREPDWLPVAQALDRILTTVQPLPVSLVPLADALGTTLAEPIRSPVDQPPWDCSAMDGFAVRAEDVRGARPDAPVALRIVDDVAAGGFPARALGQGEACRIMTGAPIPAGADSVVRIEHTDAWAAARRREPPPDPPYLIHVEDDTDAGRNVRRRGEDLARDAVILDTGRPLRPAEIGVLAAVGRVRVAVHRRPRVAILANGDELVPPERFDEVEAGRRIIDSNSWALAAAVGATGATALPLGIARDDLDSIRRHLDAAMGADALITVAGASVGDHDLAKVALDDAGFQLDFWRVRMRPGSPFSFGMLPREPDVAARLGAGIGLPVFGLPGNPVSALVTFEVLVRPALRRMLGRRDVHTPTLDVTLAEPFPSRAGLTHFLRARLQRQDGGWTARLTGPQGSGILRSMVLAEALVVVPEEADGLEAGAVARAIPLLPADPARPGWGLDAP